MKPDAGLESVDMGDITMLKIFKSQISGYKEQALGSEKSLDAFTAVAGQFVLGLVDQANAHASYRFILRDARTGKVQLLVFPSIIQIWLFNWQSNMASAILEDNEFLLNLPIQNSIHI